MYNILFVSSSLAQNGTEMCMMNVLRNVDKKRFHIDFCIFDGEMTPNRIEAESLGCHVHVLPSRQHNPFKYIIEQFSFLKKHARDYDVVHWNGGNLSSFVGFVFYRYFGIPIRIVHAHSSCAVGLHNKLLHRFHRLFLSRFCTHYFACSSEAARFFFRTTSAIIVNNGIDVNKFDYNENVRKIIREELGIGRDEIVIGHVGRFDDNKNHTFLLDIFSDHVKSYPKSLLLLIGCGDTFDAMKCKAKKLCISDRVIFTGARNDVNCMMQAMDCFVMPSKFEGLPFVLVEAQCSGLPCIISDTINKDADLTGNTYFVSLNEGTTKWSEIINKAFQNTYRKSQSDQITRKGFSILDTAKYLETVYSST